MLLNLAISTGIGIQTILIMNEMIGRPFKLLCCTCQLNHHKRMAQTIWCMIWIWMPQHYRTTWLGIEGFVFTSLAILYMIDDWGPMDLKFMIRIFIDCIILIQAGWYVGRWLYHSKAGRDKLKNKVLGRVKVTLGGLKVVPENG